MAAAAKRPPRPGSAWEWDKDKKKWVKPDRPGSAFRWNDDQGWVRPDRPNNNVVWSDDQGWVRPGNGNAMQGTGGGGGGGGATVTRPGGAGAGVVNGRPVASVTPTVVTNNPTATGPNADNAQREQVINNDAQNNTGEPPPPQEPDPTPAPAAPAAVPDEAVGGTFDEWETGGWVRTYQNYRRADGSIYKVKVAERQDRDAGETFKYSLMQAGVGQAFVDSIAGVIDDLYNTNAKPSNLEVMNAVRNSDVYKARFKGVELMKQRIADGTIAPGTMIPNEAQYITMENDFRTAMSEMGMPRGFYDSTDDFAALIGNDVSLNEVKSRVDTASQVLNNADQNTVNMLQQYYGLSKDQMVAYLLDPTKAEPLLNGTAMNTGLYGMNDRTTLDKMYDASTVGGAAARAGVGSDKAFSEEIVQAGKTNDAEGAFAAGAANNTDLKRLGSLYGEALDYKDLVRESLNLTGGVQAGQKRRKLASKERAAFGGQGALDATSLRKVRDV